MLETWIHDYPHDFARGTIGALNALIKSIISRTHLFHYGSGFLLFLEQLPSVDQDAAWALKADISDTDTLEEDDDDADDETGVAETEIVESTNGRSRRYDRIQPPWLKPTFPQGNASLVFLSQRQFLCLVVRLYTSIILQGSSSRIWSKPLKMFQV